MARRGKGQQGDRWHDDGDVKHDVGDGQHNDGKGQQGDRRYIPVDGWLLRRRLPPIFIVLPLLL